METMEKTATRENVGFGFGNVDQVIDFINQYTEHGDKLKVCKKLKYDTGNLSKMLHKNKSKRLKPRFDVLKELKKIADQNYRKVH
jgi:hypothetical protein